MKWLIIFDVARHIPEVFFFLVAGPLSAAFAYKRIREGRDPQVRILRLQKNILEMAQFNPLLFKEYVVPMVTDLDTKTKGSSTYLQDGKSSA